MSGTTVRGNSPLLFLHLPKTGGTSVTNMLKPRFAHGRSLVDADSYQKQSCNPNDYDFICGHVNFSYARRLQSPPVILTILRDPLERTVSTWAFTRYDVPALHSSARYEPARDAEVRRFCRRARELSLLEFLKEEPALANSLINLQTRHLLHDFPDEAPVHQAQLEEACANLEQCDVIGLTDALDDVLDWLAQRMGWAPFGLARQDNRTSQRPAVHELDPEALEILTDWNRLDRKLYEHARKLIVERRPRCPSISPCLPSLQTFRFDRPLQGCGWHEREWDQAGCFCWTGYEESSWLEFQAPRRRTAHVLTCQVAYVIHAEAKAGFQVAVNGQPVKGRFRQQEGVLWWEGRVSAETVARHQDRMRISFRTDRRFQPSALNPSSGDRRWLGIALRQIQLRAV